MTIQLVFLVRRAFFSVAVVAALGAFTGCGSSAGPAPATRPNHTDLPVPLDVWSAELENQHGNTHPLVPIGNGTLEQDDITVLLRQGNLQIKFVPLTEWVIRLTAPDTYRRLNGYKVSRSSEILSLTQRSGERGWPLVAFVTFFSQAVEESYEPNDLQVRNQSRVYRPLEIIPVTPEFGRDRLRQQETQVALFLFSPEIDLNVPTTISYGDASSDRWNGIRSRLDTEFSRASSRAGAGRP